VKSSFSNPSGDCVDVEFSREDAVFLISDTKESDGPKLRFTRSEWSAFIRGVKLGEFDPEEFDPVI